MEDVRYYVMSSVRENVAKVMERNRGVRERLQLFPLVPVQMHSSSCEVSLFSGCVTCLSVQRVHAHVKNQRSQSGL